MNNLDEILDYCCKTTTNKYKNSVPKETIKQHLTQSLNQYIHQGNPNGITRENNARDHLTKLSRTQVYEAAIRLVYKHSQTFNQLDTDLEYNQAQDLLNQLEQERQQSEMIISDLEKSQGNDNLLFNNLNETLKQAVNISTNSSFRKLKNSQFRNYTEEEENDFVGKVI